MFKNRIKESFFSNVTTVLPSSGLVRDHAGSFRGKNQPAIGRRPKHPRNYETTTQFLIYIKEGK